MTSAKLNEANYFNAQNACMITEARSKYDK